MSYGIGTTSCNQGDEQLLWIASNNQHPVIAQNMYRITPEGNSGINYRGLARAGLERLGLRDAWEAHYDQAVRRLVAEWLEREGVAFVLHAMQFAQKDSACRSLKQAFSVSVPTGGTQSLRSQSSAAALMRSTSSRICSDGNTPPPGESTRMTTALIESFRRSARTLRGCCLDVSRAAVGLLRLGKFIRLVPHPVMFGFVNGLAIVIFMSQLIRVSRSARETINVGIVWYFLLEMSKGTKIS